MKLVIMKFLLFPELSANGRKPTILMMMNTEYFVDFKMTAFTLDDNVNNIAQLTAMGRKRNISFSFIVRLYRNFFRRMYD